LLSLDFLNYRSAQKVWTFSSTGKVCNVLPSSDKSLGDNWGAFFSQTHLVTLVIGHKHYTSYTHIGPVGVENIIVIYLVRSDPILFPPIFHCLILPAKLLTPPTYFHGSAFAQYILLYRPLFFSIVLDSKPFGSNKGYHSCSPLPSFPYR
jgi:hypothetical protein